MIDKTGEERISISLERLYREYGYTYYRMSNFEEYDLYARNRNFLVGNRILSFTDADGRLMAFKPDVTLSIIKNTKDDGRTKKIFYNEHVVRVPANGDGFKEIPQTGLECLGRIDIYQTAEMIFMAIKSLDEIKPGGILALSDLDILTGVMGDVDEDIKEDIIKAVSAKNIHGIRSMGLDEDVSERLCGLVSVYEPLKTGIKRLEEMGISGKGMEELKKLTSMLDLMGVCDRVVLDPSVVDDLAYYNSVIFKGYIDGAYERVLSGGRYDNMMRKMGRSDGAIGFAIYMDALESLERDEKESDWDVTVLYDDDSDPETVIRTAGRLISSGYRIRIQREADGHKSVKIKGKEVTEIE